MVEEEEEDDTEAYTAEEVVAGAFEPIEETVFHAFHSEGDGIDMILFFSHTFYYFYNC